MGRKNRRKHVKIRPIRASKYINKKNNRRYQSYGGYQSNGGNQSYGGNQSNGGNQKYNGNISNNVSHSTDTAEPAAKKPYMPRPRRGDIWFAQLGDNYGTHVEAGIHPVFVISNDTGNRFSGTCTVVPLTSKMKKMDLPTHILVPSLSCTESSYTELKDLVLLAEQVATLDKSALIKKIAFVSDEKTFADIEKTMRVHLGLEPVNESDNDSVNGTASDALDEGAAHMKETRMKEE